MNLVIVSKIKKIYINRATYHNTIIIELSYPPKNIKNNLPHQ